MPGWVEKSLFMKTIMIGNGGYPFTTIKKFLNFLSLESAQAGLSWITVLKKRENYRKSFAEFEPKKVARFTSKRVEKLLQNPGIIRNRNKSWSRRCQRSSLFGSPEWVRYFFKLYLVLCGSQTHPKQMEKHYLRYQPRQKRRKPWALISKSMDSVF